jgi:hypothetical protein
MLIKVFKNPIKWLMVFSFLLFNCHGNNNEFVNDANIISTAKIILNAHKKNQLTGKKDDKSIKNLMVNELKKIYLNGQSYQLMVYCFPQKKWNEIKQVDLFYLIKLKNNGILEDFLKIYGFIDPENIGNYNYNKGYFSIDIPRNFFQGQSFFNIKYFNMSGLTKKIVFSFFPSIDDQYKSIVEYQGSNKIAIKQKKTVDTLQQWWSLFNNKQWDEKKIRAIVGQWNLKYLGNGNNYNVYQIGTDDDSLILLMVNQTNNYMTILIEAKQKGTFSDSYFYTVFPEINNKSKYQ